MAIRKINNRRTVRENLDNTHFSSISFDIRYDGKLDLDEIDRAIEKAMRNIWVEKISPVQSESLDWTYKDDVHY